MASAQSTRTRLTSSGESTLLTTVARAPFSNRTRAVETSSLSVSWTSREAMARTSAQGPSRCSRRSYWWMPCPMVGPPPSVDQRPRQGTA
ncbi:hypothetical protein ID867_24270 [Streptomyces parvulus]|nr:hypothetical protein [Streptomyces parvulus]